VPLLRLRFEKIADFLKQDDFLGIGGRNGCCSLLLLLDGVQCLYECILKLFQDCHNPYYGSAPKKVEEMIY